MFLERENCVKWRVSEGWRREVGLVESKKIGGVVRYFLVGGLGRGFWDLNWGLKKEKVRI